MEDHSPATSNLSKPSLPTTMEHSTPSPNIDPTSQIDASLSLSTAVAMKSPPTFLGLALETREQIYKYLLVADIWFPGRGLVAVTPEKAERIRRSMKLPERWIDTSIMFVSKQVFAESSPVLYKMNLFNVKIPDSVSGKDRPNALSRMRRVKIIISGLFSRVFWWQEELEVVVEALSQNTDLAELDVDMRFRSGWPRILKERNDVKDNLEPIRKIQVSHKVDFVSVASCCGKRYSLHACKLETPRFFDFLLGLEKDMLKETGTPCLAKEADFEMERSIKWEKEFESRRARH